MTNQWTLGITKATGTYCGIPFSGTIVDSMVARLTGCDVKIVLDVPFTLYGLPRTYLWEDSEAVTIDGGSK